MARSTPSRLTMFTAIEADWGSVEAYLDRELGIDSAILDGEAVVLDERGASAIVQSFQHHEMIEVPMQDGRQRHRRELLDADGVCRCLQSIALRSSKNGERVDAVTRDAALHAELLERHPLAQAGQDDRQRRGAALDRLHLEHGGCPARPVGLRPSLARLALPAGGRERLPDYMALLVKWNRTYNLTAVRTQGEMVSHHLLDSMI